MTKLGESGIAASPAVQGIPMDESKYESVEIRFNRDGLSCLIRQLEWLQRNGPGYSATIQGQEGALGTRRAVAIHLSHANEEE